MCKDFFIPTSPTEACNVFPHNKLYKEILLHQQLRHPNIASLLGFCLRGEEVEGIDLETHGVVAVYELGETVLSSTLIAMPGEEPRSIAHRLAQLDIVLSSTPYVSDNTHCFGR